jgi:TetR/AcrR family transcriptional regulator, transcriptional repressor for nem operon
MGVTRKQAAENRQAIIDAAAKLFRERGVAAVGLNELMEAAGFTRGGFYNHFKSKDALVSAVMAQALETGSEDLARVVAASRAKQADPLQRLIDWYLSPDHRRNLVGGCPLSGFAGDVRRLDPETREAYARGLQKALQQYEELVDDPRADRKAVRRQMIAVFSEMVGALVLSRAVVDADPVLAEEILSSVRRHLHATASV